MKAARLHGPGDVRLHEEPTPIPLPGESLVRVRAVGLCGSDLHWYAEGAIGDTALSRPLVLGHEMAGVTENGQRVAIDPAVSCGTCDLCAAGHPNLCPTVRFCGHGKDDGSLREWMAWPTSSLQPLPETLTDADGAMLEPLGVALHAVDLGHVRVGMAVGVFGCGPIGLLALQVARLAGATTLVATELPSRTHRMDAARALGARVFAAEGGREGVDMARVTGGLDVAIELAGTDEAVAAAVAAVRPGGTLLLAGIPSASSTSFDASAARRKGLTFRMVRRMKHVYPRAIRLVAEGHVDVRALVTHRFPLDQAPHAFAVARAREGLKVLIEP